MNRLSLLPFLLLLCTATTAAAEQAVPVEGYLFSRQGPVANARVRAYATLDDFLAGRPAAVSRAGEKTGHYLLDLPAGSYYLTARGTGADGRPLFAYHGLNPVTIAPPRHWLPFFLVPADPARTAPGFQGISGQVLYKDRPLARGVVSVYPAADGQYRGMGLLSNSLDGEGRFFFDLEPGRYVVVARHHRRGNDMGPLQRSDLFCFAAANPVEVRAGEETMVTVRCYPRDDLAGFLDDPRLDPRGRREPQRRRLSHWQEDRLESGPAPTAGKGAAAAGYLLAGRVVDRQGRGQRAMVVAAYPAGEPPLFQMYALRLITPHMTQTGADGSFRLRLPAGGYFLQARERLGEAPAAGERYGLFEGDASHAVVVGPGPPLGPVTIVADRIMPPLPDAPPASATPAPAGETGPAAAAPVLAYRQDTVLRNDTTWQGTVEVNGVVVVGRRATLSIAPGTTVRFHRLDRNRDAIGDGELRVLGRLEAVGTPSRPIVFTSAAASPAARDWSYVLLYTASGESRIEHCRFSYAFTGLQVHFSTARVKRNVFRRNHEGIRFGRAHLTVEENRIEENDIGIRFTRMEGPVILTGNRVSGNRIGVFLVPSGQNTRDFFEPERSGRPWNTGRLTIRHNDIAANLWYNLDLGAKQIWDLDVRNNWWGTPDPARIQQAIFDRHRDPGLGKAILLPVAGQPCTRPAEGGEVRRAPGPPPPVPAPRQAPSGQPTVQETGNSERP